MTAVETDTATVLAIGEWPTNAHLVADCARLGYLPGRVLDATHGYGNWWSEWQPDEFVSNDANPELVADYCYDFRHFPAAWAASFDTVTLDGPYKLNGTPSEADIPFGVHVVDTREGRMSLIRDGITECERVLKPEGYLLVKCQDQVNGGKVRWQTDDFTAHALSLGLAKVDSFLFRSYRAQPADRRQVHARRNYSTLLIFQKPKRSTRRGQNALL